jgi:hypothetical protein
VSEFPIGETHFSCFVFEVDKAQETYQVTGKMQVKVPTDVSDEELREIENVLAQTIAISLGVNTQQIKVVVDPETSESTFVAKSNDPTLTEEMQKFVQNKDFTKNVNKDINKNSGNLPARIAEMLAIDEVKVNSFFRNNKINNFTCYSLKM